MNRHDALAGNVRHTLETANTVLEHFEWGLMQGGFAEGAGAYRQLADTLLGQRLWMESAGAEVPPGFRALGERALAIHALLSPYLDAMCRLGALAALSADARSPAGHDDGKPAEEDQPVLAALEAAGRALSHTALRASLGWQKAQLEAALERLEAGGRVRRWKSGGRALVERVP